MKKPRKKNVNKAKNEEKRMEEAWQKMPLPLTKDQEGILPPSVKKPK